jgi:hypothetical protein
MSEEGADDAFAPERVTPGSVEAGDGDGQDEPDEQRGWTPRLIAIAAAAGVAIVASLVFVIGDDSGGEVSGSLPTISASTERQQELREAAGFAPALMTPEAPAAWGENLAQARVDSQRDGPWLVFTPEAYDHDGPQAPTLVGLWVLHEPESDGRTQAVFVTATLRPHDFVHPGVDGAVTWGGELASAAKGLRSESGIVDSDVAQSQQVALNGHNVWLLSGFGDGGANDGMNFSYVVFDDGAFFYTLRLAGDERYFDDFTEQFLEFAARTQFRERD